LSSKLILGCNAVCVLLLFYYSGNTRCKTLNSGVACRYPLESVVGLHQRCRIFSGSSSLNNSFVAEKAG